MEEYDIYELNLNQKQSNQLKQIQKKKNLFLEKDKSDYQTIDQILDARIRRIITKLKKVV